MKKLLLITVMTVLAGSAGAITIDIHSSNVGIGTMSWSISGSTITILEDWDASGMGTLEFDGLSTGFTYTVVKEIYNNTGTDWDHFANELLDEVFHRPGFRAINEIISMSHYLFLCALRNVVIRSDFHLLCILFRESRADVLGFNQICQVDLLTLQIDLDLGDLVVPIELNRAFEGRRSRSK